VAAAHHRERIGVMEVGGTGQLGDRHLAGIDQVGVDLVRAGGGTHVEHAVLGVQHHAGPRGQVVGHGGGSPDAEVDVRARRDVDRDRSRELILGSRVSVEVLDRSRGVDLAHRTA
jgi:hypothetical protein